MNVRRSAIGMVTFAVLLAAALTPVFAGGESEPTEKVIRIGVMGGQTGPAASSVVPMFEELENVFSYINEVEGGIDGIQLEWRVVDNKGTPEGCVTAYKEFESGYRPLFYVIVEDYYYLAIKEQAEEEKVAMFTMSALDPRCYLPPSVFFSITLPVSDGFAGFVLSLIHI